MKDNTLELCENIELELMLKIQITENILKVLLNSLLCSVMFPDVGDTIGMILVFKEIGGNFPCSSVSKEYACNTGDPASILGREDPLEKEMAAHSSVLAWRTPWTEEPGRLQSMGPQELGMT